MDGDDGNLAFSQKRVCAARNAVARQRAIVRKLEREDRSADRAYAILRNMEGMLALMLHNRDRRRRREGRPIDLGPDICEFRAISP
jgi:hypothetical protein